MRLTWDHKIIGRNRAFLYYLTSVLSGFGSVCMFVWCLWGGDYKTAILCLLIAGAGFGVHIKPYSKDRSSVENY